MINNTMNEDLYNNIEANSFEDNPADVAWLLDHEYIVKHINKRYKGQHKYIVLVKFMWCGVMTKRLDTICSKHDGL